MATPQLSPVDRFERILLASEGSNFSAGADRIALDLARQCGAEVTVMGLVVTNDEMDAIAPDMVGKTEQEAMDGVKPFQTACAEQGVSCRLALKRGMDPAPAILQCAEESEADVVVMGRRGKRGLWSRLMVGQATTQVVGKARCKVLVAPQQAEMWRKRILLAVDGSRHSDAAALAGIRLAKLAGLPMSVLSVIRAEHSAERRKIAEEAVARIVAFAQREEIPVEGVLESGEPSAVVVDFAQRKGADLIVGGGYGHTSLKEMFLGGVIERIIGVAPCPVLTIRQ